MIEKRKLIPPFFLIFISILFLAIFVLPTYQKFKSLKGEVLKSQKFLSSFEEYVKEIEKDFTKIKEKEAEISKINSALPFDPKIPQTLNFLQKSAAESGLLLKGFSFSLEEILPAKELLSGKIAFQEVPKLRIQILLSGDYQAFKNFLKKVENSARLIKIENLSISKKETFEFKLGLKTFFLFEAAKEEAKKLKLNLELLENQKFKNLEPFFEIGPPSIEEIGKENPWE